MTDDLITFVRAQLDERARAAELIRRRGLFNLLPAAIIDADGATVFFTDESYALISAAFNPDAVLADVDAKRRILDQCESYAEDGCTSGADLALTILPLLALPFADHPDYRSEWAVAK